jgi:hypothetical protein
MQNVSQTSVTYLQQKQNVTQIGMGKNYIIIIIIISGSAAQRGLWPSRPRGFLITHNDAPQSVGLQLDE